jgi:hypothetical protein
VTAGGTADELDRALDALPLVRSGAEPLERNARFAAAEFDLADVELEVLLLALRLRRSRLISRPWGPGLPWVSFDHLGAVAPLDRGARCSCSS